MLQKLFEIEKSLPHYLRDGETWNSVYVDYHKPYVKRLWRQIGDCRVYLHQIFACDRHESLLHPHPWPSAMKVINGKYEMGLGYSPTNDEPVIASTLILPINSYYEMADINSWHYVRPLESESFSLMVTGTPWKRESPKSGHPLRELHVDEKIIILSEFKKHFN